MAGPCARLRQYIQSQIEDPILVPRPGGGIQYQCRPQAIDGNLGTDRHSREPGRRRSRGGSFAALARLADYDSEDELLLAVGVGDQLPVDLAKLLTQPGEQARRQEAGDRRQETLGQLFCLTVRGRDRDGLLRDVMTAVAAQSISVRAANARTDRRDQSATISLEVLLADAELPQLFRAEADIRAIADVIDIRRTTA